MSSLKLKIKVCFLCESITDYVEPITEDQLNWMKRFSVKIENINKPNSPLYLCVHCNYLFKKVIMVLKRIVVLYETIGENINSQSTNDSIKFCLIKTKPEVFYIGPEPFISNESSTINLDLEDMNESHWCNDDDMPLVKKEQNSFKKKKNKAKSKIKTIDTRCIDSIDSQKIGVEKRKNSKKNKNGFTSRMVAETDEYVVIRLTKDQVLEEMSERSKTERYIRSPYKCVYCIKGFNFEDVLTGHNEKHIERPGHMKCELCSQYCPNTVSMRGHMKSHYTRYKCKLCDVVRNSRQHLLEHFSTTHTGDATEYRCQLCNFTTTKRTVMQRHAKSHKDSDNLTCDECGKTLKTIESLRVHRLSHDKSKMYGCEQCQKKFIYQSTLNKHVLSVHVNKEYYCVECDIIFKSLSNMRLHFRRVKKHRDTSSYLEEVTTRPRRSRQPRCKESAKADDTASKDTKNNG